VDKGDLLALYRADVDLLQDGEAAWAWWREHYEPVAGGWIERGDDPASPNLLFEGTPDFERTTFLVGNGEGEPACRCYRCGGLLTLDLLLVDSPASGHYRPICQTCKEKT
jgi:hypothetical protein